MRPETDEQFAKASRAIAGTFLDRFAAMGMTPDEIANLTGAALAKSSRNSSARSGRSIGCATWPTHLRLS
jgi:hypothetical protein